MGKLLKILGIVFVVIVLGFVGLMIWSHEKGEAVQEDFFTAVLSGEPAKVKALFHPELAAQVDDPVLAAWMGAVKTHLGAFHGLAASNFNTSMKKVNGREEVLSAGTIKFDKGEAKSKLRLVDGKIVAWEVTSEALPANWMTHLDDTALYEQRAKTFLTTILTGDAPAALALMHEKLRAKFDATTFAQGMQRLQARFGAIQSMDVRERTFDAGPPQQLRLRVEVTCAKEKAIGLVRFVFQGMTAHVVGFEFPESGAPGR